MDKPDVLNDLEPNKKHYMSWPVIALIDFVTIISFENIFYPFQNQGLSVVISWIFLLFTYVIPYALISSQMSLTFDNQDGGLASWVRRSTNDTLGYWTSWMYWVQSVPYIVDVSNSVIVSFNFWQQQLRQEDVDLLVRNLNFCDHFDLYFIRKQTS